MSNYQPPSANPFATSNCYNQPVPSAGSIPQMQPRVPLPGANRMSSANDCGIVGVSPHGGYIGQQHTPIQTAAANSHQRQQHQRNPLAPPSHYSHHMSHPLPASGSQPMTNDQYVRLWAGDNYNMDSGIQSSVPSGAPSIMSNMSLAHEEVLNIYNNSVPMNPNEYSFNLPVHDDISTSMKEVIRFLHDMDEVVVKDAVVCVRSILYSESHARRLEAQSPTWNWKTDLTLALIEVIDRRFCYDDEDCLFVVTSCLTKLSSSDRECTRLLAEKMDIRLLILLMKLWSYPTSMRTTCNMSIVMHNMLSMLGEDRCSIIAGKLRLLPDNGTIVHVMHSLLSRFIEQFNMHEKLMSIFCDCYVIVIASDPRCKTLMVKLGSLDLLIQIMRATEYEKLLYHCARVLKAMSRDSDCKDHMISKGVVTALQKFVNHYSSRVQKEVITTLLYLGDKARSLPNLNDLLSNLLNLFGTDNPAVMASAAGIIQNLTSNNADYKAFVCERNGVSALCRQLCLMYGGSVGAAPATREQRETVEGILTTLRHLTHAHPLSKAAQDSIFNNHFNEFFPALFYALSQNFPPIVKAGLLFIRNLSCHEQFVHYFVNMTFATTVTGDARSSFLFWLVNDIISGCLQNAINSTSSPNRPSISAIDCGGGVKLQSLFDQALGCLKTILENNRSVISVVTARVVDNDSVPERHGRIHLVDTAISCLRVDSDVIRESALQLLKLLVQSSADVVLYMQDIDTTLGLIFRESQPSAAACELARELSEYVSTSLMCRAIADVPDDYQFAGPATAPDVWGDADVPTSSGFSMMDLSDSLAPVDFDECYAASSSSTNYWTDASRHQRQHRYGSGGGGVPSPFEGHAPAPSPQQQQIPPP